MPRSLDRDAAFLHVRPTVKTMCEAVVFVLA